MDLLLWIVFGGLAGWIASLIMKTNRTQGILMDIILGVIGGVLGGFLLSLVGLSGVSGFNIYSLLVSVLGAIILIWLSRVILHTNL